MPAFSPLVKKILQEIMLFARYDQCEYALVHKDPGPGYSGGHEIYSFGGAFYAFYYYMCLVT